MFSLLGKRWANKRFQDFSCTIFVRITLSFASLFILSLFVFLVVAKFPADHFWATSSLYKAGFPKQTALTIRESYALLEKAASHQLCATTSRDNYKYASNRFARIFRVSITTTLHFQSWS
ncbi:uncharacterized protein LOC142164570 isoform X3 [Nicotiana tabacum]|uniref:Uncharacterized protein LOC142164570 isoform X3 n=2 Tax=Nicotiana tabacum TaxID=4097 RepID=A0AC58S0U3_TOBAC